MSVSAPQDAAVWVALVGPELEENLGLRYLSAALGQAGFHTGLVPFNEPEHLIRARELILGSKPPPILVALALSFQWRALDFLSLAMALREAGYQGHITAGGHFGSLCRQELLEDVAELDSICRYEAEGVLVSLASALATGRPLDAVAGLTFRQSRQIHDGPTPAPVDLSALPWPDRRGSPALCLGHAIAPLVSGRGCYAGCAFCCIAAWHREGGGLRFRSRPVEDVAEEMVWLQRHHGTEIFIFHDDNFFLPTAERSLSRIHALADALEARQARPFTTVVKARPNDVTAAVFVAMKERLGISRLFLGVETNAAQGLQTLNRRVTRAENHRAMQVLTDLDLYVCFNLLIFDPDATLESLEANLAFMERWGSNPFNFGRAELYAGTPLLARLQAEGRCRGDYLGWDYDMAVPPVQRVFKLAMRCFYQRNFAADAVANRLQGTHFDVATARHFHREVYRADWLSRARALSHRLAESTVAELREIITFVRRAPPPAAEAELVSVLSTRLRATDAAIAAEANDLEETIQATVGRRCRHLRPEPSRLDVGWPDSVAIRAESR